MKAIYALLLLSSMSNAEQQPVSNRNEILKKVYYDCRKNSDVMTCVDKLTKFGKQIGLKNDIDEKLEMSLFFLVQDDLSSTPKAIKK